MFTDSHSQARDMFMKIGWHNFTDDHLSEEHLCEAMILSWATSVLNDDIRH